MAIKETEVWITLHTKTVKHFESLGYKIPRSKNKHGRFGVLKGTKLLVKVNDLPPRSWTKVTKICDDCGEEIENQLYSNILKYRENGDGKDRCHPCGSIKGGLTQKNNIKYKDSVEYYALHNNKEYLIKEFSDKNSKKLSEIFCGTHDKYLWNCPDCKSEYDIRMADKIFQNQNCPYCAGKRVNNTNALVTTHPHVAKLLSYPERGYEITAQSNKRESFTCPECGDIKHSKVNNITNKGFSCSKCSDGISYPEKFMMSMLNQLNIKYDTQKRFKWSDNKKYDFYISPHIIIETHGEQHYVRSFVGIGGRTLEEEQENDRLKEKLAKENGIEHYIVIDCSYSNFENIKNNIFNSKFNDLFELNKIDWLKCHEYACNSLVREVCDLWNSGIKYSGEIANIMHISSGTAKKYLKQGTKLGLCDYDPKNAKLLGQRKKYKNARKIVQLAMNGEFIKEWNSICEAETNLNIKHVSAVCRGIRNHAGNFKWLYKENYEKLIKDNSESA